MPGEGSKPWIPGSQNCCGRGYSRVSDTDAEHIVEDVTHNEAGYESLDNPSDPMNQDKLTAAPPEASKGTCDPFSIILQLPKLVWESGSACIHASAVCFSISNLCVKLTAKRLPVAEFVLVRSIICVAITYGTIISQGLRPFYGNRQNYPVLALRGLTGATAMIASYLAVHSLPLPDAVTLFFTNPAVTAVFAWVMLGEQFGWVAAAGCVTSLTGALLVTRPPLLFGHAEPYGPTQIFGVIMGAISSVFASLAYICVRVVGKKEPALKLALWFHSASFVTSLVALLSGWPEKAVVPAMSDAGVLVLVGFTGFGGQLFINRGFQLEQAAKASSINLIQVLYSYILGVTIFGDRITVLGCLGSLMVTSGVLIINLRKAFSKPAARTKAHTAIGDGGATQPLLQPENDTHHDPDQALATSKAHTAVGDGEATQPLLQPDDGTHHDPAHALATSTDCSGQEIAANAAAAVDFLQTAESGDGICEAIVAVSK